MSLQPTPPLNEPGTSAESTALERALDQNAAVQDTVEQSAAELVMINAVLKQEIPDHVQVGDIAQALQRTDELEVQISHTAQDLAQVNEVLAQEIDEREDLERELAETKAALAQAQLEAGNS
jgi:C4-dicarboxylate-specific signal transduction histidine kinase